VVLALAAVAASTAVSISADGEPSDPAWDQRLEKFLAASRGEHDHGIERWVEAAAWTFDDGKIPESFNAFEGKWEVADGQLRAVSGAPDGNRVIQIANCRWPAFRLEFDASLHANPGTPAGRICDLGVRLNADPETGDFREGYVALLGAYYNQATVIYRHFIPYARTEWSPLVAGKTHRVVLEVVKPHIRLWVDDRVALEAWEREGRAAGGDPGRGDFLDMDPRRAMALHTYDNALHVDNLRILVPAAADDDEDESGR
jgi:hypothetical protein